MSMISWLIKAQAKPNKPNPMMENTCPNKKCCGNPACKMNANSPKMPPRPKESLIREDVGFKPSFEENKD